MLGLTVALGASACAATTGNGFAASQGKCVSYEATVDLGQNESINLAGEDMSGHNDGKIYDSAMLENKDGETLILRDVKDASVDFSNTHVHALSGSKGFEIPADTTPDDENTFIYHEGTRIVQMSASAQGDNHIAVHLKQNCTQK